MKKTALLLIAAFMLLASANAQITKGQKMIGGDLTFSSTKQDPTFSGEYRTTTLYVSPEIGFGLSNNWIVGGGLVYSHQGQKNGSGNTYSKQVINTVGVSVFGRKFHPFRENVGIFGQLDIGTGFGKAKETQAQGGPSVVASKSDVNTVLTKLSPGFYFKPTRRIILEAGFGGITYASTVIKQGVNKTTYNEFNISLIRSIGLSFRVIL